MENTEILDVMGWLVIHQQIIIICYKKRRFIIMHVIKRGHDGEI